MCVLLRSAVSVDKDKTVHVQCVVVCKHVYMSALVWLVVVRKFCLMEYVLCVSMSMFAGIATWVSALSWLARTKHLPHKWQ